MFWTNGNFPTRAYAIIRILLNIIMRSNFEVESLQSFSFEVSVTTYGLIILRKYGERNCCCGTDLLNYNT